MKPSIFYKMVPAIWLVATFSFAQTPVETRISIYQGDMAFVQEKMQWKVRAGHQQLIFQDLPAQIIPSTLRFVPESEREFQVLSLFFVPGTAGGKILPEEDQEQPVLFQLIGGESVKGVLVREGDPYWIRTEEGKIRLVPTRSVVWMEVPQIQRPEREKWVVQLKSPHTKTVTGWREYFVRGMKWEALYWVYLSEDRLFMEGWAQLDNRSGKHFDHADIQLIAGEVNLTAAGSGGRREGRFQRITPMMAKEAESVEPQKVSEYYRFRLPGKITLRKGEIRKVWLFSTRNVRYKRAYVHDSRRWPEEVRTEISFKNEASNRLGRPLAAGRVFLFREGDFATLAGTDRLKNTPVGREIRLHLGTAFDLTVQRKQVRSAPMGKQRHVESYEITFHNAKKESVVILSREYFFFRTPESSWRIVEASDPYQKTSARTAEFSVRVPPASKKILRYTVEYSW